MRSMFLSLLNGFNAMSCSRDKSDIISHNTSIFLFTQRFWRHMSMAKNKPLIFCDHKNVIFTSRQKHSCYEIENLLRIKKKSFVDFETTMIDYPKD